MVMHEINGNRFYNESCITGTRENVEDNSVDLIITDPPYGIKGDQLHKHYNRNEEYVVDGYVEIPAEEYNDFSHQWIKEAERILKPNGQIYIVSGYTNLYDILDALRSTKLREINHIIWKYNFGVYTQRKYISSHYHILYYEKPGPGKRVFNRDCRYGPTEKTEKGGSRNYRDREDVWLINREYKPGREKNKNELPTALLVKMIQYSSVENDLVCDLFLGGFSTVRTAIGLKRRAMGFEISSAIFTKKIEEMKNLKPGFLLDTLREPLMENYENQGRKWESKEKKRLISRFSELMKDNNKSQTIKILSKEFGRGRWSIEKILKKYAPVTGRKRTNNRSIEEFG